MVLTKEGNTTIVSPEEKTFSGFKDALTASYSTLKNDHIIVALFSFEALTIPEVLEFLQVSNSHRAAKKSFVLVTKKIGYQDVPETLCVVPSIQEAKDLIEMEEIERDLDL